MMSVLVGWKNDFCGVGWKNDFCEGGGWKIDFCGGGVEE